MAEGAIWASWAMGSGESFGCEGAMKAVGAEGVEGIGGAEGVEGMRRMRGLLYICCTAVSADREVFRIYIEKYYLTHFFASRLDRKVQ